MLHEAKGLANPDDRGAGFWTRRGRGGMQTDRVEAAGTYQVHFSKNYDCYPFMFSPSTTVGVSKVLWDLAPS